MLANAITHHTSQLQRDSEPFIPLARMAMPTNGKNCHGRRYGFFVGVGAGAGCELAGGCVLAGGLCAGADWPGCEDAGGCCAGWEVAGAGCELDGVWEAGG